MKPWNGNAPLAWIAAIGFLSAVSWPHFSARTFPLIGLQGLTVPHIGWPLAISAAVMAVFLSVPTLLSRERLLICSGFALCLFLAVSVYVSPAAALLFGFIGANIIREAVRTPTSSSPDRQDRHTVPAEDQPGR